jgi:hypothetical protein
MASVSTSFPIVIVSNDVGFFKVNATDLTVTPFKELMTVVDFIHVSHDTIYFLAKVNHTVLSYVFGLSNVKYEVMSVSADMLVSIMCNIVPCTDEIKAFCNDPVNTSMFHIMYNFFRGVIVQNSQPVSPATIDVPSMEVTKDDALTIDELIAQWDVANDSSDSIDEILMDLSNEDIFGVNTNTDAQWEETNVCFDPIDEILMELSNEDIICHTDDIDIDMDLFVEA